MTTIISENVDVLFDDVSGSVWRVEVYPHTPAAPADGVFAGWTCRGWALVEVLACGFSARIASIGVAEGEKDPAEVRREMFLTATTFWRPVRLAEHLERYTRTLRESTRPYTSACGTLRPKSRQS